MKFHVKPGDKVGYSDFQFGNLSGATLDHIRVYSFGEYAALKLGGQMYTVPYKNVKPFGKL